MGLIRVTVLMLLTAASVTAFAAECSGRDAPGAGGRDVRAFKLEDGSVAAFSGMNINIDGYGRAYHRRNRAAGAVLHLCVGGRVWLPDGTRYEGSESNATCTGKFMNDLARIEAAGWSDPAVGVIEWYGIVAEGSATVAGRQIRGIKPVEQKDGSGFYVSPTRLADRLVADPQDQRRYVHPLRIAAAVVPRALVNEGIGFGSFGVAIHTQKQVAVPFVVGDAGPRVGEGTPALARQVSGLPTSDVIDLKNRYAGQVNRPDVLWVFFGGATMPFDHRNESGLAASAQAAFSKWGGSDRVLHCLKQLPNP